MPGVIHAAAISGGMPLGGSMSTTNLTVPGRPAVENDRGISIRRVTSDYHRTMEIPLKRGRLFEHSDRKGAQEVVIINESAAAKYFPGEDPVGQVVNVNGPRTVVGVVGDVYQSSLETEPMGEAYIPLSQARVGGVELVVRTSGDPLTLAPELKAAVLGVLPDVPLRNLSSMEQLIGRRVAQRRLNMLLLGLFGVLGLVISAVGIYGVLAYTVSQRTREIGVRMALGATRSSVMGMVLLKAATLVGVGLVIGTAAAWLASGAASRFLFKLEHHDLRAFAIAIGALAVAALLASALPARRAASVDPMEALRAE
jgi:predicted permease